MRRATNRSDIMANRGKQNGAPCIVRESSSGASQSMEDAPARSHTRGFFFFWFCPQVTNNNFKRYFLFSMILSPRAGEAFFFFCVLTYILCHISSKKNRMFAKEGIAWWGGYFAFPRRPRLVPIFLFSFCSWRYFTAREEERECISFVDACFRLNWT